MYNSNINRKAILFQAFIFIVSVGLIVLFMPRDESFSYHYSVNSPWRYGQLIANFDFHIVKSEKLVKAEEDSLLREFKPYFDRSATVAQAKIDSFKHIFGGNHSLLPQARYQHYLKVLSDIYMAGVISGERHTWLQDNDKNSIMEIEGNIAKITPIEGLYTEKSAYELLTLDDTLPDQKQFLARYNLNNFIVSNLIFNEEKTTAAKDDILSALSRSCGYVYAGQKIIDRGDIVDEKTAQILESMRTEWNKRLVGSSHVGATVLGQILFVSILILLQLFFVNLFRSDYFDHKRKLMLLFASTIAATVSVALMMRFGVGNVFILPLAIIPMILRVFMDSRTAFMGHIIIVLLCSAMLNYPYDFVLLQTVAGFAAIYSLRELSQRSQLFRSAFYVFLSYALTYFAYELIQEGSLSKLNYSMYIYFFINGVLLLFTYPLMYLIEKTFGFTSNVTLVELSNINNPLLRELSETTPGTFQHSMQVSNLAAEAALKVGAHSQLVRTGALYHDIGKMKNPIYFTENQQGVDLHKQLSYEKSAQIIISHVTDGLKLAEKYHLPQVIKDFIATHHGKGKTNYFYILYKNEHPGEPIDESLFTYPGPNPSSTEMAIVMMADAVEAASKSIKEYTAENINTMVDKIIDSQVSSGFFTECPITFKDISTIKAVFKEKLKSIYHTRINYPEESQGGGKAGGENRKN